jgi:lipid II isoglutaminyl synthase (glutamine-hydrolysing)
MNVSLSAAIFTGKVLTALSRRLGFGAGSNFPGRAALRIRPQAPEEIASLLAGGCVLVSGTNGKTTTSNLLAGMLRASGLHPVHNKVGANLMSGITAALTQASDLKGKPRGNIGLFEVDEAVLPTAIRRLNPRLVILTNLYRDQLDRYGELESLGRKIDTGLEGLDESACILLNADDPLVAFLGEKSKAKKYYYGIEYEGLAETGLRHAADSKNCRVCGEELSFAVSFFGHMGKYSCSSCGLKRPPVDFAANRVELRGVKGSRLEISTPESTFDLSLGLPGLYNVQNLLAALGGAELLGLEKADIETGVEGYSTAFGRGESIAIKGRTLFLILSKNPTGFNEVIRMLAGEGDNLAVIAALNDRIADGRDVSWIWDVDFEELAPLARFLITSGTRARDMALRMKYAGLETERMRVEGNLRAALDKAIASSEEGETIYALTTYTATLDLRRLLTKMGMAAGYWEEASHE